MRFQRAYNVMLPVTGVLKSKRDPPVRAVYQPANARPMFVGVCGCAMVLPCCTVTGAMLVDAPFSSNRTVYVLSCHCAYNVASDEPS